MESICLSVNVGSSSVKVSGFNSSTTSKMFSIDLKCIDLSCPIMDVFDGVNRYYYECDTADYWQKLLRALRELIGDFHVNIVGFRIKFGGSNVQTRPIDQDLIEVIEWNEMLSSNHNSILLSAIEFFSREFKSCQKIGVFDNVIDDFEEFNSEGGQYLEGNIANRYDLKSKGHHGLAVHSIIESLKSEFGEDYLKSKNVCILHLGSGVSVTQVIHEKIVNTSMKYCASDGVMMNKRSGNIEPGLFLKLIRGGMSLEKLASTFTVSSGIYAYSKTPPNSIISAKEILKDTKVFNEYVTSIVSYMNNLKLRSYEFDHIVFSGGIIGHSYNVVSEILKKYKEYENLNLDENIYTTELIDGTKVSVYEVDEQKQIFNRCMSYLTSDPMNIPKVTGICVVPGIVDGVITESIDDAKDKILLLTEMTPLNIYKCSNAKAVLSINGTPTSHSSAIARELNLPCACSVQSYHILSKLCSKRVRIDMSTLEIIHVG